MTKDIDSKKPRELYHDDITWVPKSAYDALQAKADRLADALSIAIIALEAVDMSETAKEMRRALAKHRGTSEL